MGKVDLDWGSHVVYDNKSLATGHGSLTEL